MTCEEKHLGKEESTRRRVVKLTTVVTLHGFDGTTELSVHRGEEIGEDSKSVGL